MTKSIFVLAGALLIFILVAGFGSGSASATDCIGGGVTPYTFELCP
jgi:hypothetical protein